MTPDVLETEEFGVRHIYARYGDGLGIVDSVALVYSRVSHLSYQDVAAKRQYRIVVERWHDDEDDHGYYQVCDGEDVWPMTYRTRVFAERIAAELVADGYPERRARVELVPVEVFTPYDVARLLRRVARRASRAARRKPL